jgi:hypothetical protein
MAEKSNCSDKLLQFIKWQSLGKYRTPLFYRKADNYSSLISGILSLVFVVVMLIITVVIFIPIFRKDTYELDRKSVPLYRMILDEDGREIYQNETCTNC